MGRLAQYINCCCNRCCHVGGEWRKVKVSPYFNQNQKYNRDNLEFNKNNLNSADHNLFSGYSNRQGAVNLDDQNLYILRAAAAAASGGGGG